MKIVLINPDFDEVGDNKNFEKVINIIPPLGLMYIASVLEKHGFEVRIIDCYLGKSNIDLYRILKKESPDIVGISTATPTFGNVIEIAEMIHKNFPDTFIVIGGYHVSAIPRQALSSGYFDAGVIGEGEITFLELVKELQKKYSKLNKIKGLAIKKSNKIIFTKPRPFIKNLDNIPFPARHLVPSLSRYKPTPASYKRLPVGILISSRGCASKCTFCDRAVFGCTYRERSPSNVLDEVEEIIYKFGAKELKFFDDNFTLNKKRLFNICDEFKKRKIDIEWSCLTKANLVSREILMKMKKAGCWQVLFGLESGDSKILNSLNKGITLEQGERAVKLAKKVGLSVRADFLMGVPGENLNTMVRTLNFAKKINPSFAHFNKFTPYPGTEIYKRLVQEGYKIDFNKFHSQLDHLHSIYSPKGMSKKQLGEVVSKSYKRFYLRPGYMFNRLFEIRDFESLIREINGFFGVFGL